MNFDDFTSSAGSTLWQSASDWFKASIPKPPGTPEVVTPVSQTPITISMPGAIDTKTILMVGGALFAGLALFVVMGKKGKR